MLLSTSWLPVLIALVALLIALYLKRATIRTSELVALAIGAAVLFLLLTGAFHALHLPDFALHLF